jgi:hypothetical protein
VPPNLIAILLTGHDKAVNAEIFRARHGFCSTADRRIDNQCNKSASKLGEIIIAGRNCMLVEYFNRLKSSNEGGTEMKAMEGEMAKPSYWQLIFLQSKVNGAAYNGEDLPGRNWDWPKDTYLQKRLDKAKFFQPSEHSKMN